jgi:hypothetical protein
MDCRPAAATTYIKHMAFGADPGPPGKGKNLVRSIITVLPYVLPWPKNLRKKQVTYPLSLRQNSVVKALNFFGKMPDIQIHLSCPA